ncbi:hypothetical protein SH449x_001672 [Pirellulaceae bacterium SH449]
MATKTATKTNRNAKAASKATTTKAAKKNATVAKPAAKESKPADKKMSQIEAASSGDLPQAELLHPERQWKSLSGTHPDGVGNMPSATSQCLRISDRSDAGKILRSCRAIVVAQLARHHGVRCLIPHTGA